MSQADPSPSQTHRPWRKLRWALLLPAVLGLSFLGWYLGARYVWFNVHEVVPGEAYRSSQPSPTFLAAVIRDKNLQCVIKLNSESESGWSEHEVASAATHGVKLIHIPMGVTRLPTREELTSLVEAIDSAPRPLLVHCKIGADRTGVASTLIAMHDGMNLDEAVASQLTWKFLHLGHVGEAVEDVFDQYREDCARLGRPTGGWAEFRDYVLNDYYPSFYRATIDPTPKVVEGRPGEQVSFAVRVTNASPRPWRTSPANPFALMLSNNPAIAWIPMPALPPGESVTLDVPVTVPNDLPAGTHSFRFDIAQKNVTLFSLRGSPPATVTLVVKPPTLASTAKDSHR